jgi:hypothetical protein
MFRLIDRRVKPDRDGVDDFGAGTRFAFPRTKPHRMAQPLIGCGGR